MDGKTSRYTYSMTVKWIYINEWTDKQMGCTLRVSPTAVLYGVTLYTFYFYGINSPLIT
jgi:hypothetical protein